MASEPQPARRKDDLRARAEKVVRKRRQPVPATLSAQEARRLIHELEVHQVELEMQNEELLRARADLEAGLARYTELYDFAPVGYLTLSREGVIRAANLASALLLGVERSRLVGSRMAFLVATEYRPAFQALVEDVLKTGSPASCEMELRPEAGPPLWVRIDAAASDDKQECRVAMMDVTARRRAERDLCEHAQALETARNNLLVIVEDRRRAEAAVQAERDRLAALVDSMADEVWFTDTQKRFTLANRTAIREFQLPDDGAPIELEELVRRLEILRSDGSPRPIEEAPPLRALAGEVIRGEEEIVRTPSSRELRHRQINSSPVRDAAGNILGVVSVVRDITQQKRAEADLRETNLRLEDALARAEELTLHAEAASRAKTQFLANMSHEIRTPMTAILGFADLLMVQSFSPDDQQEFLQGIQRNGKALMDLISDILDLSRIEAERMPLEKVEFPLRQFLDDVLSAVRVRADQKGLALAVDYEPPLPQAIRSDPVRLRQILANLVGNAVKFTDRGQVRIAVRVERGAEGAARAQFAVSDTGIGIPPERIGELFQPFVQLDASFTRRYGGTGLGLAISRRLARALGGDVEVTSELGRGSTFTLTIDAGPLAGAPTLDAPSGPEPAARELAPDDLDQPWAGGAARAARVARVARVLFAEDVPEVSHVIRRLLQKLDVEAEIAEDGRVACEMAQESQAEGRPYDLIFMDIQMPVMDGLEATQWLRQHGWQGPIVALTAHALSEDREACLAAGCDDYLSKPVTRAALLEVMKRHIRT